MKTKRICGVLIIITLILTSCEKQENEVISKLNSLALVTGIKAIDHSGNVAKIYGNPNDSERDYVVDNDGYIGVGSSNYAFYPNPVSDVLSILTFEKIESVWIVEGEVSSKHQDFDFADYFSSELIDTIGISRNSLLELNDFDATNRLNINLSDKIDDGIYKIILKTQNSIHWFSIIKSNEVLEAVEDKYIPW